MADNKKKPIKLALHGMDSRITKAMMMFLQGPCNGAAIIVNDDDAEIDVYDYDTPSSKILIDNLQSEFQEKPVILMSLKDVGREGAIYLQKPIKPVDFLRVLEESKNTMAKLSQAKQPNDSQVFSKTSGNVIRNAFGNTEKNTGSNANRIEASSPDQDISAEKPSLKTYVYDSSEQNKTAKHQTAMRLDEKSFHQFLGSFEEIDINDRKQIALAFYNPKDYYQGFVQSAYGVCLAKKQILTLESVWEPITLFPRTQEVWFDASDLELRSFAGLVLSHESVKSKIKLTPVSVETISKEFTFDKFQSMETFLWKLACWTSKGFYPKTIDYLQPIYLKRWPNFTRLLITPHALRITALLSQGPRTMESLARALDIKLQYVFVYVSATHAIGMVDQARRAVDCLVEPPGLQQKKNKGLLGRILNKLRGN